MSNLIQIKGKINKEGIIFNKWLYNRMIKRNQNVLSVITGPTGSGKSYQDLRRAELWYKYYFKTDFPSNNICFSISSVMKRLSSGTLRRGEILIFEEAGANLGNLDFQTKISKMFTYILQSFRSMNVAIFFNLPFFSMLNKGARMLVHVHFLTYEIDRKKKVSMSKGFFLQVNQTSGKVYSKFIRVNVNGMIIPVAGFWYSIPSDELIRVYEMKKLKFVSELSQEFSAELERLEMVKNKKEGRKNLSEKQAEVYNHYLNGLSRRETGKLMNICYSVVSHHVGRIKKKGYLVKDYL